MRRTHAADVLLVSLGSTEGLRRADDELQDSLRRVGARVAVARPFPQEPLPTLLRAAGRHHAGACAPCSGAGTNALPPLYANGSTLRRVYTGNCGVMVHLRGVDACASATPLL